MKIVMMFLSYSTNIFGGMERATHFLARGLVARGAEVIIITGNLPSSAESDLDSVRLVRIRSLETMLPATEAIIRHAVAANRNSIECEVVDALRLIQPDYILIVDPVWGVLPHLAVWDNIGCPVGLVFHVCHEERVISSVLKLPINDIFCVSDTLADELRATSVGIRSRDIQILPNCVCLSDFPPLTCCREDAVFVFSRISPEKGIADIVQAYASLAGDFATNLWLCGGAFPFGDVVPTRRDIERTISRMRIVDRVTFLPQILWSDIPRCLQTARLVVLPSHRETFGMAALEAMAAGTPLIVSRAGNLPHLVGDAALTVESGDVAGLESAMRELLTDDDLARTVAARGLARARAYDAAHVAGVFLRQADHRGQT